MTENAPALSKIDKAPRPPHVILLADLMGRLAEHRSLDALVVCWSSPETPDRPASIGSASVGSDAAISFLLQRHLVQLVSGDLRRKPVPRDT